MTSFHAIRVRQRIEPKFEPASKATSKRISVFNDITLKNYKIFKQKLTAQIAVEHGHLSHSLTISRL